MCELIRLIIEPTSGTGYKTYTRKPLNQMTELAVLQIQEVVVLEFTAENTWKLSNNYIIK